MAQRAEPREGWYSAHQVAEAAGISYRMLDYWLREGWIAEPERDGSGSGYFREFSEHERERIVRVATEYREARTAWLTTRDRLHSGALYCDAAETVSA